MTDYHEHSDRKVVEAYWNGVSVAGNGSTSRTIHGIGTSDVAFQVKSDGDYNVNLNWLDSSGNTVRSETQVFGGATSGNWNRTEQTMFSPRVEIEVADQSGTSSNVSGTVHAY